MKKFLSVIAVFACLAAIFLAPMLVTAHEAAGEIRAVGGCHSLQPDQQLACRTCLNRGGGFHFHPQTNICHENVRPPQKNQ